MTTEEPGPPDSARSERTPPVPATILLHTSTPPEINVDQRVDVRPGAVATFDGDRVRLTLVVTAGDRRARIGWRDVGGLERAISARLDRAVPAVVRFGDRAACRTALGAAGVGALERRLAAAARAGGAALVTWTSETAHDRDGRTYDVVDNSAARVD